MILIVTFFKQSFSMNYERPLDLLILAGGVLLISGSLVVAHYVSGGRKRPAHKAPDLVPSSHSSKTAKADAASAAQRAKPKQTYSLASSAMILSKSCRVDMRFSSSSLLVTLLLISTTPPRPPRPFKSPYLLQSQSLPDRRIYSI